MDHVMQGGIDGSELAEVQPKRELADCLGSELQHILIDIPRLPLLIKGIKDPEGLFHGLLHRRRIMPDGLWPKSGGQEFMGYLPFGRISVTQEDACGRGLQRVKRVGFVDLLGEKVGLRKGNRRDLRVIGLVHRPAHVLSFNDGAILLEETLVVSKVVGIHFEVVADIRQALWTRRIAYAAAINRDGHGATRRDNFRDF